MNYALVHWESENSYSTVSLKKIDTGSTSLDNVVGGEFRVKWNRQFHTGRVVGIGSHDEMEKLELDLAQAAADLSFAENDANDAMNEASDDNNVEPSSLNTNLSSTVQTAPNSSEVLNQNDDVVLAEFSQHSFENSGELTDTRDALTAKDNEIAKMHSEMETLRKQNKRLHRLLRKGAPVTDPNDVSKLQITDGIELEKSVVDLAKLMYSNRPSVFFRKLIFEGGLFSLEEIADSSITGKSSPMFPGVKRPRLDPVRFEALKKFTKESCGLQEKSTACILFEQSLKNLPGDARKKLKGRQQGRTDSTNE